MPTIIDHATQRPIDCKPAPVQMVLRPIDTSATRAYYEQTRALFPSASGYGTGEELGLVICERNAVKRVRAERHAAIREQQGG